MINNEALLTVFDRLPASRGCLSLSVGQADVIYYLYEFYVGNKTCLFEIVIVDNRRLCAGRQSWWQKYNYDDYNNNIIVRTATYHRQFHHRRDPIYRPTQHMATRTRFDR